MRSYPFPLCLSASCLCRNHRILDLRAFRGLVERGLIPPEEFITIGTQKQQAVTTRFKHSDDVKRFYDGKMGYKVAVSHVWMFCPVGRMLFPVGRMFQRFCNSAFRCRLVPGMFFCCFGHKRRLFDVS